MYPKKSGPNWIKSEIAHLTGVGKYASDAWRIFCKDELYRQAGRPLAYSEWENVCPTDKELLAYIKWKREVSKKKTPQRRGRGTEDLATDMQNLSLGGSAE